MKEMAKEWQTFVRKFEDMREGELELFIKDLTPGPAKYDCRHVRARVSKAGAVSSGGDILWLRSESGSRAPEPWDIKILEELPPWVPGRPWENVFDAIEKAQARKG